MIVFVVVMVDLGSFVVLVITCGGGVTVLVAVAIISRLSAERTAHDKSRSAGADRNGSGRS